MGNLIYKERITSSYLYSIILDCGCSVDKTYTIHKNQLNIKMYHKIEKKIFKNGFSEYIIHCDTCKIARGYYIQLCDIIICKLNSYDPFKDVRTIRI